MKWICMSLVFMLIFGGVTIATAGETGRYEAIKLDNALAFVIDTAEGHMWVVGGGDDFMTTIYFGKVRPGSKMGELIDSFNVTKKQKP